MGTPTHPAVPRGEPEQFGCLRPFALAYKARLTASSEDQRSIRGFLVAYRETSRQIARYFMKWHSGSRPEQFAASLLIMPGHLPSALAESAIWAKLVDGVNTAYLPAEWRELVQNTLYQNMRALAGLDRQRTLSGDIVCKVWDEFRLPRPSGADVESIFGRFPQEAWRTEAANAVQGTLRSYFSQCEKARRENSARRERLAVLRELAPAFFDWLERYVEDQSAHAQACRLFQGLRRELRAAGTSPEVIHAAQQAALLSRPASAALHPRFWSESLAKTAAGHPDLVARFAAAIPTPLSQRSPSHPERVRRFCSAECSLPSLARDPHFMREILSAVDRAWNCFDQAESASIVNHLERRGAYLVHAGWELLHRSTSARDRKIVALIREARKYCRLLREITVAPLREDAEFSPLLPWGQGRGWQAVETPAGGPKNSAALEFDVPAYRAIGDDEQTAAHEKRRIRVSLRGHLPTNRTTLLAQPPEVKAGLLKFRPDRRRQVAGQHPADRVRQIYLKPQALRLTEDRSGLVGTWGALHMTEADVLPSRDDPRGDPLKVGERIGVICLLPGGTVLADVLVFEKAPSALGWALATIEENRRRTDAAMPTAAQGRQQPIICKRRPFVRLDAASVDRTLSQLLRSAGMVGDASAVRAEISRIGRIRSSTTDTGYKQMVARIGRILLWNRCRLVLIAGRGKLQGPAGVAHPIARVYDVATHGGLLVNALNKAGLHWIASTNKFRSVWAKDFIDNPETEALRAGATFRRRRQEEICGRRPGLMPPQGAPTHIELDGKKCEYAVNAGWAALLGWSSPRFRQLARALVGVEEVAFSEIEKMD